jgi:putative copper export protein
LAVACVPMDFIWVALRWLHLLAMAFFVGGQLFLVVACVPVLRDSREHLAQIARRFGYGTLGAIAVLIVSGSVMASHYRQWENPILDTKLGLIGLVAILIATHIRYPARRSLDAAIFLISLGIVWLGIALSH